MRKIKILHNKFVNEALFPFHMVNCIKSSLPGKLAQNINNRIKRGAGFSYMMNSGFLMMDFGPCISKFRSEMMCTGYFSHPVTWSVEAKGHAWCALRNLFGKCVSNTFYALFLIGLKFIHLNWAHKFLMQINRIYAHLGVSNSIQHFF